jgi:branched-subunit amino acid aminotransferase/4-amino-4-deoxychorismate lyase
VSAARGCYSSARACGGRVWHAERHAQRLARDARLLGLGEVDAASVLALLQELALPTRDGADTRVRVEVQLDGVFGIRVAGTSSPIGDDAPTWRCVAAAAAHPGASPTSSAKRSDRSLYEAAFAAAREAGVEEALLFDAVGRLVEGTRSNVIVVRRDGAVVTPALESGAQAGLARGLLIERVALLREAAVSREELATSREILATNAVRGVRPVLSFDGLPVGDGQPGPWAARLEHAFRRDC